MGSRHYPALAILLIPLLVLLMIAGPLAAEWSLGKGRIWVGPPANPERYYRFATDNGIPGTGRYAYSDYNWPSLRQALQQYGLFGRRYGKQNQVGVNCSAVPVLPDSAHSIDPSNRPSSDFRTPSEEPLLLKPPRKLGE